MINTIITDFSHVLLKPADPAYSGPLNPLNKQLLDEDPNYNFLAYFTPNDELFDYFIELNKQLPVYVFTSGHIQDHPVIVRRVQDGFRDVFSASKLGVDKHDVTAFEKILELTNAHAKETIYIDDKQKNLDVAMQLGITTLLYRNNGEFIPALEQLLGR